MSMYVVSTEHQKEMCLELVIKSWLKSFTMKSLWRQVLQHRSTLFNKSNRYLHLRNIRTYFRNETVLNNVSTWELAMYLNTVISWILQEYSKKLQCYKLMCHHLINQMCYKLGRCKQLGLQSTRTIVRYMQKLKIKRICRPSHKHENANNDLC
jgi:hypothetical protein